MTRPIRHLRRSAAPVSGENRTPHTGKHGSAAASANSVPIATSKVAKLSQTLSPTSQATMRASLLLKPGTVQVQDVPVPALTENQVLVQVSAVGVCGSDTHFFKDGHIGDMRVQEPLILGHEAAGMIVAVGGNVPTHRIGERVSIEPQKSCRSCEYCKSGRYNLCPDIEFFAAPPVHGAFAEYAAIESDYAYTVPDHVSDEAAALMEPLSVAIATCRKAGITPGSTVLIAGAGPIGILAAQVARIFGATEITVSDPAAHRREFVLKAGATHVLDPQSDNPSQHGALFDVFVDASGAPPAISTGIQAVKPGGKAILVGMGSEKVELPVSLIQNREIELTGIFRYTNTWPTAIELVASGKVNLDSMVTHRFSLEDVEAALLTGSEDPYSIKSVVIPPKKSA